MRILLIANRFPYTSEGDFRGSIEARTYFAARALAREHEVTVIASGEDDRIQESFQGIRIVRCGSARSFSERGAVLHRFRFLYSVLRASRACSADVVEGTSLLAYEAAQRVAKQQRIPAVCTYHDLWLGEWRQNIGGLPGLLGYYYERRALRFPWTKIIAVSTTTRAKLIEQGIPSERIDVIPNGVPTEHLPVGLERFDQPTVITVSRLVKYKRINDVIDAVAELRKQIPNIRLFIVGSGPERRALQVKVRERKLEDAVLFHGFIPKFGDVLKLVAQSHVLCSPSVVEGFGLVTVEAMAVGTPYVATDIPATNEVTQNGVGGVLYPPGSIPDLVSGLRAILTDRSYGDKLGMVGRNFVLEQYSWDRISDELCNAYRTLGPVARLKN